MNEKVHTDSEALIDEIGRYLAAVDVFRAEGCEPSWRPEHSPVAGLILSAVQGARGAPGSLV